ncbi:hypothetical protein [Hydrogenophaga sp.]|uniref:hypothetical protein n=1 Tax=Hydrogenophaga sp. TaxID=1904254 RepID=UPI003F7037A1
MPSETLVFDPALLVWDREHFRSDERSYWQLVGDLMTLFDVIDRTTYELVLSSRLAELVINDFPADELSSTGNFTDFLRATYSFLARISEARRLYTPKMSPSNIVPDIASRPHFSAGVSLECRTAVIYAFEQPINGHVLSHGLIWPVGHAHLTSEEVVSKVLPARLGADEYLSLCEATRRIYEKNDKHDSACGYGSRLPDLLDDTAIQSMLDVAVEVRGQDCLCARSVAGERVLLFRRHHKNCYHAYPIEEHELSKYGINPRLIPAV